MMLIRGSSCPPLSLSESVEWEVDTEAYASSARERHTLLSYLAERVVHAEEEVEACRM